MQVQNLAFSCWSWRCSTQNLYRHGYTVYGAAAPKTCTGTAILYKSADTYIKSCDKISLNKIFKILSLWLIASAYSPAVEELIVELIDELFIGELLNYNF